MAGLVTRLAAGLSAGFGVECNGALEAASAFLSTDGAIDPNAASLGHCLATLARAEKWLPGVGALRLQEFARSEAVADFAKKLDVLREARRVLDAGIRSLVQPSIRWEEADVLQTYDICFSDAALWVPRFRPRAGRLGVERGAV
eukprot:11019040-Alexandrium_andersonii.AAC.1